MMKIEIESSRQDWNKLTKISLFEILGAKKTFRVHLIRRSSSRCSNMSLSVCPKTVKTYIYYFLQVSVGVRNIVNIASIFFLVFAVFCSWYILDAASGKVGKLIKLNNWWIGCYAAPSLSLVFGLILSVSCDWADAGVTIVENKLNYYYYCE